MRVAVVRFPGSNCDLDAVAAMRSIAGLSPELVWHESDKLGRYDAVVLPGGFSFGDYLRAGSIAARSPAMSTIRRMADRGTPILGVCNGFQILVEAGLLPGALLRNSSLKFVCDWVNLRVDSPRTPFTLLAQEGQVLRMPIAHGEGRYYAADDEMPRAREGPQDSLPLLGRVREGRRGVEPHGRLAERRRNLQRAGERGRSDAAPGARLRPAVQPVGLGRRSSDIRLAAGRCNLR